MLAKLLKSFNLDFLSFRYNEKPFSEKSHILLNQLLQVFFKYYFKASHEGALSLACQTAKKHRTIVITHHANTIEAAAIYNFFFQNQLGKIHGLIFKQVFHIPFVREYARALHCLPVSVNNGIKALKMGHIILMPEGLEFYQRYTGQSTQAVMPFHLGFLRMAQGFLQQSQTEKIAVIPVAHAGMEQTLPIKVLSNQILSKYIFQPFYRYPVFFLPKQIWLNPGHALLRWGHPTILTQKELNSKSAIQKQAHTFREQLMKLKLKVEQDFLKKFSH